LEKRTEPDREREKGGIVPRERSTPEHKVVLYKEGRTIETGEKAYARGFGRNLAKNYGSERIAPSRRRAGHDPGI